MDAYKNAHVNTIDTVLLFMEQKKEAILPFAPAIAADITALTDKRAAITAALENAALKTTPVTERKNATRNAVVTTGRGFAAAAMSHASSKNDPLLLKEFKDFKAKLSEAKDADLPVVAGNLLKKLQGIAKELTDRGVSTDDLANFAATVAQFKADAPSVKNSRNTISSENAEAEKRIAEARDIIVLQIGGTLEHIQDKIPAIYAAFRKTAKLQKAAVASTELTIIALHGLTNAPLEGVTSTRINEALQETGTQNFMQTPTRSAKQKAKAIAETQQMRTSATGEVVLKKNISKGEMYQIAKDGYETLTVLLPKLKAGKKHTIEVRLMPIAA
jgi:hypothetical protein